MMRRLIYAAVLAAGVALGLLALLLFSQTGLGWTVRLITGASGGKIVIGESFGQLAGDWRLKRLVLNLPGNRIEIAELAGHWQPADLLQATVSIARLSAREVNVRRTGEDTATDEPPVDDAPFVLPSLTFPLAVVVGSMDIDGLTIEDEHGAELLLLTSLSAKFSASRDLLRLAELRVQAPAFTAEFGGSLQISADWPLELAGTWLLDAAGCSRLQGRVTVAGPLAGPGFSAQLEQPVRVDLEGTLENLFEDPTWRLQGRTEHLLLSTICTDWPSFAVELSVDTAGRLDDYQGTIATQLNIPDLPVIETTLSFSGSAANLVVQPSPLEFAGASGELSGRLVVGDGVVWQTELLLSSFDPGVFEPIAQGSIEATIGADGEITEDGLAWQVEIAEMHYRSSNLSTALEGEAQLTGSETGMAVSVSLSAGDGRLEADGALAWADGLTWDGRVVLDSFDPSLSDRLPSGSISAVIESSGRAGGQEVALQATLKTLSGSLAGYELQGGGAVTYQDGRLHISDLQISNGSNQLEVHGFIDDHLDLHVAVDGTELHRLYPPLQGALELSGRLSGTRTAPTVTGELRATGLAYQGYTVAGVTGSVLFGPDGSETIELTLQGQGLTGDGFEVSAVNLHVTGVMQQHLITVDTRTDFGDLQAAVSGKLDEHYRWTGRIGEVAYHHRDYGNWHQVGDADAAVAVDGVRIDGFCLDSGGSSFCAGGSWERQGPWAVALSELRLALGDLSRWGINAPDLTGTVQGDLSAAGDGVALHRVSVRLAAPEVSVDLEVDELYRDLRWFDNEITAELLNGILTTRLGSRFVDGSVLAATIAVAELTALDVLFQELALSGRLQADRLDLSPLALLTGDYLLPSGYLALDLEIGGFLGEPSLSGPARLHDGELGFPELGIALRDLHGDLQISGNRLAVELRGRSGSGTVLGSGALTFLTFGEQPWHGEFTISGIAADLVNQSEMHIIASPEVTLIIGPDGGMLNGSVHIPEASLQPDEMGGTVSSSADVVFVDQEETTSAWPLLFDLSVELGDNVQVKGYGLNARVTGHIQVTENLGAGLTGRGELAIGDGTFSLYGQPLQITRGRVLFTGGQIDNPDLDIIAQKTVRGATFGHEGTVVGVKVTGSAQDYHLELFSQPRMADNDIVAYLLLDKPISSSDDESRGIVNEAVRAIGLSAGSDILGDFTDLLPIDDLHLEGSADTGGASLVLGKRLTDDLSVSYDYNLFEHAGNFRVRYEFGRGFSVQSRNSIDSTGVELLYSFER